ncbi:MAG: NAD-binding protein [Thaumarchaeota archaeon]|nr:NAD-binding protein [Nitrososphaerota archaeon]
MSDPILARSGRSKFHRESRRFGFLVFEAMYGPIVFLKAVYRQLMVLLSMFVSGAVIFNHFDHLPFLDSLLASVSTITTIGLYVPNGGNFFTLNRTEALLLIIMIIVSVGTGASIVQSTVNAAVEGALAKGEAEERLIARLKNHVIVFGYNHLGVYVVEKLEELGYDHVVITKDNNSYQQLLKKNTLAVLEHETQPIVALRSAGIERAALVIVAHVNDPDNMLFVLSARKLRPDIRIVSVVHDSNLVETAKNAGADMVVPASVTVGHLLALSAVTKDLVGLVFSEKIGTKEIAQFSVFKSSSLIGKELHEVAKYARVIGIVRGNDVAQNMFERDFVIQEDDTILVLGDPSNLDLLEARQKAK